MITESSPCIHSDAAPSTMALMGYTKNSVMEQADATDRRLGKRRKGGQVEESMNVKEARVKVRLRTAELFDKG